MKDKFEKMLQEIITRLDNIERLQMGNAEKPLTPGDPAFRIAARAFLRGDKGPMKAMAGRKMVS